MAAKKDESKAFDVVDPSESKLNIGSKPMVIGHKPAADSTLTNNADEEQPVDETATQEEAAAPSKKIRIEPLSSDDSTEKTVTTVEEVPAEDAIVTDDKNTAAEESSETKKEPVATTEAKDDRESDKDRDFVAEAENEEQSAQDAESEREEKVEELKKSKKYHVNVKEKRDSGLGKLFAVLFAILVSIIGVYALADAEIIPGGELLPMRFIGQEEASETQESIVIDGSENQTISLGETEETIDATEVSTTEWLLFEGDGFAFRVPDGWNLMQKFGDNGSFVSDGELEYEEGVEAVVLDYDEDAVPLEAMFILYLDNFETYNAEYCSSEKNDEVSRSTLQTETGVEITKIIAEGTVPEESRELGELAEGETSYSYCIVTEDRTIFTQLLTSSDEDQNINVFEEAVQTITFSTQD